MKKFMTEQNSILNQPKQFSIIFPYWRITIEASFCRFQEASLPPPRQILFVEDCIVFKKGLNIYAWTDTMMVILKMLFEIGKIRNNEISHFTTCSERPRGNFVGGERETGVTGNEAQGTMGRRRRRGEALFLPSRFICGQIFIERETERRLLTRQATKYFAPCTLWSSPKRCY